MDDTDGPKHCGEADAHDPHEYEVRIRQGSNGGYLRLWSCDGSALPKPQVDPRRDKIPAGLRTAELNAMAHPIREDHYCVVVSQTFELPASGRMEAVIQVLEVLDRGR